ALVAPIVELHPGRSQDADRLRRRRGLSGDPGRHLSIHQLQEQPEVLRVVVEDGHGAATISQAVHARILPVAPLPALRPRRPRETPSQHPGRLGIIHSEWDGKISTLSGCRRCTSGLDDPRYLTFLSVPPG